jgi:ABC-2 type transport system ATP-binding protein
MGEPAIEVRGLVKRFGDVEALSGLDLRVAAGTCFGLLGPNGAGKTTTVGVLTTLLRPTSGQALLFGRDVTAEPEQVRRDVGLVFQESTLDPDLTAREHLDLYARLYHLEGRGARVGEMLALVALEERADEPVRKLSGGMRRRLEIARGLLHRPRLLFLDEPTLGLDVAARAAVWEHLRRLRGESGTTLFLTTHSMEEADSLCDVVAIVDRGRRVTEGTPDALKAELGGDVVNLRLARADGAAERLEGVEGVRQVSPEGETGFRVTLVDGPRRLAHLIEAVRPLGVEEVTMQRPTLEHVFLHHTGHAFEPEADGS